MRFERYADLTALETPELRALLAGRGDAPQRVWAAWALAVKHAVDAGTAIVDRAANEPAEGVRAHLALLLVAHGDRDAAVALAVGDPSPTVRAAAYRCLARVAHTAEADLHALLLRALEVEVHEVRTAALDGLGVDAPIELARLALASLDDAHLDVRDAALDFAGGLRRGGSELAQEVRARAELEADPGLRARLFEAWIETDGAATVIRAAASWAVPQLIHLLEYCARCAPLLATDLGPLADRAEPRIDIWLTDLEEGGRLELPASWLAAILVRYLEVPDGPWTDARSYQALCHGVTGHSDPDESRPADRRPKTS